ncbi:MAG: apolipoprotein N-acyltransferase [Aquificota bacterium]|nr:MAG: apolipoprotein N-acyltransferase [Aquificota bacterium]
MLWLAFFFSLALYFFSFPPFDLFFLAWVAPLPLMLAGVSLSSKRRFLLWWLWGTFFFFASLYWLPGTMMAYAPVAGWLAWGTLGILALYLGLYWGLWGYWSLLLVERGVPPFLAFSAVLSFLELVRGHLLTGFPWLLAAHSQAPFLPFVQGAALVGVYGLSFFLAWSWGGALDLLRGARLRGGVALLLPLLLIGWGWARVERLSHGKTIKVALVQPNIPAQMKWDPARAREQVKLLVDMVGEACRGEDLVVLPETVYPYSLFQNPSKTRPFLDAVKGCSAFVLVGTNHVMTKGGRLFYKNRVYLLSKVGVLGVYDKVHLVPFGEYVPLGDYFPFLYGLAGYERGFLPGRDLSPLPMPTSPLGVGVCYETIFPSLARVQVKKGAGLLVNVTNDAWFGRSLAPYQHLTAALFRAVENGRWLIRCANTGISALISPEGRVVVQTPLFTRRILRGEVGATSQITPYTILGDWLPLLSGFFVFLFLVVGYFKPGYFSDR